MKKDGSTRTEEQGKNRREREKADEMPYADTDFFVRIANSDDRLNSRALKVLESYTGETYTSILTLVELALDTVIKEVHVEEMIASVLFIARLTGAGDYDAIVAAHPIDHEKAGVFDSFHASLCGGRYHQL